jgi:hypothetical protein
MPRWLELTYRTYRTYLIEKASFQLRALHRRVRHSSLLKACVALSGAMLESGAPCCESLLSQRQCYTMPCPDA